MTSNPVTRFSRDRNGRPLAGNWLRPMKSGEVIDASLRILRAHGAELLRANLLPTAFVFAALTFLLEFVLPSFTRTQHANSTGAQIEEAAMMVVIAVAVCGPLLVLGFSLAVIASVGIVRRDIDPDAEVSTVANETRLVMSLLKLSLYEAFTGGIGFLVTFAVFVSASILAQVTREDSIIAGLVAVLGFFIALVAVFRFLWVLANHALAPVIVLVEGKKASEAARRSQTLLRPFAARNGTTVHPGGTGVIVSLLCLLALLYLLEGVGIAAADQILGLGEHFSTLMPGSPMGWIASFVTDELPSYLLLLPLIPMWSVTVTVLYFERRVRYEGYDILQIAHEVRQNSRRTA